MHPTPSPAVHGWGSAFRSRTCPGSATRRLRQPRRFRLHGVVRLIVHFCCPRVVVELIGNNCLPALIDVDVHAPPPWPAGQIDGLSISRLRATTPSIQALPARTRPSWCVSLWVTSQKDRTIRT